jgi:hypothetical protein
MLSLTVVVAVEAVAAQAAAAAVAAVVMDHNWRQKQSAIRALTVAWQHVLTKADGRKQHNN